MFVLLKPPPPQQQQQHEAGTGNERLSFCHLIVFSSIEFFFSSIFPNSLPRHKTCHVCCVCCWLFVVCTKTTRKKHVCTNKKIHAMNVQILSPKKFVHATPSFAIPNDKKNPYNESAMRLQWKKRGRKRLKETKRVYCDDILVHPCQRPTCST